MATLHVRNIPKDLYKKVQKLAEAQNRSLSAQVVIMLAQAVADEKNRKAQTKILASIRSRRFSAPKKSYTSLELLHEDRKR